MAEQDLQHESVNELFNGNEIAPQFAVALKNFFNKYFSFPKRASGFITVHYTETTKSFPHGLGAIPKVISLSYFPQGADPRNRLWDAWITNPAADITNINIGTYVVGTPGDLTLFWSAST